jgi:hypothetical protein
MTDISIAPVELMTGFLFYVSKNEFQIPEALQMIRNLLQFEPRNQILLDYQKVFIKLSRDGIEVFKATDNNVSNPIESSSESDAHSNNSSDESEATHSEDSDTEND